MRKPRIKLKNSSSIVNVTVVFLYLIQKLYIVSSQNLTQHEKTTNSTIISTTPRPIDYEALTDKFTDLFQTIRRCLNEAKETGANDNPDAARPLVRAVDAALSNIQEISVFVRGLLNDHNLPKAEAKRQMNKVKKELKELYLRVKPEAQKFSGSAVVKIVDGLMKCVDYALNLIDEIYEIYDGH